MHQITPGNSRAAIFIMLLLALIVVGQVNPARAEDFIIEEFASDITVGGDGKVSVRETIIVEFSVSRHGIYREIPFRYVSEFGDKMIMPITVNSVTREDGSAWEYRVRQRGDVINVRIGDADRYVDGRQVYVIDYAVENAILFFEDHDELYWNVTGNYWLARIKKASATVRLNTAQPSSRLTGACYTGRYGSDESDCEFEQTGNQMSFSTTRTIRASEGFTVAMGWDKGLVAAPSKWRQFLWSTRVTGNWVFLIPVGVLIFMISRWYRKGRDPRVREAVTVMYEPPKTNDKPLTPAQTGALIDESLDQRDISASLIGLAASGYLELHESQESGSGPHDPKDYTLIKLKEPDDQLSRFESTLMADIFADESNEAKVSDMKNKFYTKLPNLRRIMFDELVNKKFFATSPLKVTGKYAGIGFGVLLIGAFILFMLSPNAPWKGVIAGVVSGFVIIGFAKAMPAKTRTGALAYVSILGFQEFMNRADKDRLERMGEHVFYKYLPYAIALDVVDHWVKAYDGILTKPPTWYVPASGIGAFSASQFSKSITGTASHLGSTMFSAPRGSGTSGSSGGGGGFSGGGGGGGGGGSW